MSLVDNNSSIVYSSLSAINKGRGGKGLTWDNSAKTSLSRSFSSEETYEINHRTSRAR